MRDDDRDPSVDFVVGGLDAGPDEELAQPEGFPRLRRWRWPLAVLAAVAVVAAVAVNLASGSSGNHPAARPGSAAAGQAGASRPSTAEGSSARGWSPGRSAPSLARQRPFHYGPSHPVRSDRTTRCPAGASCSTVVAAPARLVAAIKRALPTAHTVHASTLLEHMDRPGSRLLQRVVTARVGIARLHIDVRPAGGRDLIGWNASETAARTRFTAYQHVRGRLVTVQLTAPPGHPIPAEALRRLAADPHVLSLT